MKSKEEVLIEETVTGNENRCPDYDSDCDTMSITQASWCFHGCQNHPCNPSSSLGTAKGYCPILNKEN